MKNSIARSFPRRGAALIIVLAVLAVLALLGTVFAGINVIEKKVSLSYLDEIRARLIARSGVERAITEIQGGIARGVPDDPAMQFWGSNLTEVGNPDWSVSLDKAKNPSYAWEAEDIQNPADLNKAPMQFDIDGQMLGISGAMGTGSHSVNGDVYRLLVADANSRINVNDGVEYGNASHVSQNLQRILNVLGDIVGIPTMGDRLIKYRPEVGGYRSKRELERVLSPSEMKKANGHITVHSWRDNNVSNPVPLSAETLEWYPIKYNDKINLYRYGRSNASNGQAIATPVVFAPEACNPLLPKGVVHPHAVMGLDELAVQYVERVARAPVNVNLATKEVLTALITDIRGFYLIERRKRNPNSGASGQGWNQSMGMYSFMLHGKYANLPGMELGDEIGWLYTTPPFTKKNEVSVESVVTAEQIAEEMVACRGKQPSPHCPSIDYGSLWYGGPFRSWRQFNAWADGLVTGGLLKDPRNIFRDCDTISAGTGGWGSSNPETYAGMSDVTQDSPIQRDWASQAMADVLKANFNPNLTFNEANPDLNLFTIVDKTDLITCSTEFCFQPMGIFDIESEGLIVVTPGNQDFLKAKKGRVVARRKIAASVKAYEAHRETSQTDFYRGEFGHRLAGSTVTNNNRTMESGPEADNGPAPKDSMASGWLQLSTVGGPWIGSVAGHMKGSTQKTPVGHSELGDVMHSHFALDHRLHFHADTNMEEPLLIPTFKNQPDRTETCMGPYGPAQGLPGQYRIARDYTPDKLPNDPKFHAMSDMRIDGAYIERDGALMFHNSLNTYHEVGTACFWVKPSFHPAMSGKPRTFFSCDAKEPNGHQLINGTWFFASHDNVAYNVSPNETAALVYSPGPWRPCSLSAGFCPNGFGGIGAVSGSLNHKSHKHKSPGDPCFGKKNVIDHHKWIHIGTHWDMATLKHLLQVNGETIANTEVVVHPQPDTAADWMTGGATTVRLGEPSSTNDYNNWGVNCSRNWTADATIDEFYMWKGKQLDVTADLYSKGRYYRPRSGREGQFTSGVQNLKSDFRNLAPASAGRAPAGNSTVAEVQAPPGGYGTVPQTNPQIRILGLALTWYPEMTDHRGKPMGYDEYSDQPIELEIESQILVNEAPTGPILKDLTFFDGDVMVYGTDEVKYRIKIRLAKSNTNSILLGSPMIDDVTIFFTTGLTFLAYELQD